MIERAFFLCVAVAAVIGAAQSGKCPARCQCLPTDEDYHEAVSCAYQNRSDIPADFSPDTEYIKYEGNNLMELTRDFTFPTLPKLRRLDLYTGKLRKIGADAFSSFHALEVLYLNDNMIEIIEAGAFRGLSALRLLNLAGNKLSELPDSAINALNLDFLWLTNNRLTTIGNDTFKGATVGTLELSGNAIGKLPANALFPLRSNLTKLIWNNNKQPLKIARTAFSGGRLLVLSLVNSRLHSDTSFLEHVNAKQLDLSGNQLSSSSLNLAQYTSMQTVQHLRMGNMSLTAISSQLLPNSRWLRTLDLTGNKLTVAPGELFKWVTGLETILLGDNLLTRLPERLADVLPGLRELRVFGNRITTLDAKTLAPFAARRMNLLDISGNRVQTLHESLLPLLNKIDTFMASGNPLHCNCELLWYHKWLNGAGLSEHGLYDSCMTPVQDYIVYLPTSSFTCTAPRIANVTPNKQVNEGDDVFLTCSAIADPAPEVEWTAPSGEAISITPSQDRSRNQTIAVWRVAAISPQQAGIYTCTASNLRGNVTVSVCVGVRTPGSTRTVCDGRPATAPTTTGPPQAPTTVSRAETTAAAVPSLRVTTTHDDVISSSSTSIAPTGAETTVAQSHVTTRQQHVTVVQPRVNATSAVSSRVLSTMTFEETTIDTTHWTESVGLPDTINLPRPSVDKESSSGGWVSTVIICLVVVVVVVVVAVIVVIFVYVRRRRFSRSTYFSAEPDDKSIADKNSKVADTEIALISPREQTNPILGCKLKTAANDKPEKDAMLSPEEIGNAVEKAGQEGTTAEMVKRKSNVNSGTSDTFRDSAVLLSNLDNIVVATQSSAERGITEDPTNSRQVEGYSGPSQSNPAFVLSPGTYSTETNVDETHKYNKEKSSESNSEQKNVEKRNTTGHKCLRSYSANPEGATSLSTGRLSRGETEA